MRKSLKDIRTEKGLMQKEITKSIKISTAFYSLIESGERMPSLKTAKKIAACLGLTLDEFYEALTTTIEEKSPYDGGIRWRSE